MHGDGYKPKDKRKEKKRSNKSQKAERERCGCMNVFLQNFVGKMLRNQMQMWFKQMYPHINHPALV